MKIMSMVAVLAVAAGSLVVLPRVQALPYIGLDLPAAPPTPPVPPAPPAIPAMASIDVVPESPEPPEPPVPAESWSDDDGDKYVLSAGDMNVENGDGDTNFNSLHRAYGHNFFWFRHDGRAYVVREAATIRELVDLYRPQSDLGREQGALGRKQGALGWKQGELGRRQGELGREQGRLGIELARLAMRFDEDDPAVAGRRRELERKERELSRRQGDLGKEQGELGREQSRLGEEQSKLGDRQAALSREIEHKLRPMIEEMIRKGIAEQIER